MFKHNLTEFTDLRRETDPIRVYVTPEGKKYPSVTTVTGLYSREGIQKWRQRVGNAQANAVSKMASARGTKVHNMFENYVKNEEVSFKDVTRQEKFMFMAVKPIIDLYLDEVWAVECKLYSDELESAGQVDLIGIWNGQPAIIDWKTSSKRKPKKFIKNYCMQLAAYAQMFEELTGKDMAIGNVVIAVQEDHPQVFTIHKDNHLDDFRQYRAQFKEEKGV